MKRKEAEAMAIALGVPIETSDEQKKLVQDAIKKDLAGKHEETVNFGFNR